MRLSVFCSPRVSTTGYVVLMALALCIAPCPNAAAAPVFQDIESILERRDAPEGVVIEIVSGDRDLLDEAMPLARDYVTRLRARFPDLEIAVVTHGKEQFALTREHKQDHEQAHATVKELVSIAKVPVHICETYAGMNQIDASQFPDYVDVAPSGPAQINNYRELGYLVVRITGMD